MIVGRPSKAALQAKQEATGEAAVPPAPPSTRRKVGRPPKARPDTSQGSSESDQADVLAIDPLLTPDDVARWLGKPKGTLYQWRSRGLGPRAVKIGGDLRYRRSDVEAFIEANADPITA